MSEFLEHLGRDTLPRQLVEAFVQWCIWEQAHPAWVSILAHTGLTELADKIKSVGDLQILADTSEDIVHLIHEARNKTGVLGLSTAEASLFLVNKIVHAAQGDGWDPDGVAFYASQAMGWSAFAKSGFKNAQMKSGAEQSARKQQEEKLRTLWRQFGTPNE